MFSTSDKLIFENSPSRTLTPNRWAHPRPHLPGGWCTLRPRAGSSPPPERGCSTWERRLSILQRLVQWATEREISSFCRKPKERHSKSILSAEIPKLPKECLSAERGCFCRKRIFRQGIQDNFRYELRQIIRIFLPKQSISAETRPFCRKKFFLQNHRKT